MKKILFAIQFAVIANLLLSCTTEVDEIFNITSSERLQASLTECRQLLSTSENGWLIQYYPSASREYGGHNFVAKFGTDGYVEISGDVADDISKVVKSHYSVLTSNGITLSFDTYNSYLHYWSDPDYWAENMYGGDFEWMYVRGDRQEMVFQGVKTGNTIVFTALKNNMITRLNTIVSTQKEVEMLFNFTYAWSDGSGVAITLLHESNYPVFKYYPAGNTSGEYILIPYIYTDSGIMLYEAVNINNITVQYFDFNPSVRGFTSVDAVNASGGSVTVNLTGFQSSDFVPYDKILGSWNLNYYDYYYLPVTIIEKVRNKSYTMIGCTYDIEISYSKTGLSIYGQAVDSGSNDIVYLCMWNVNEGILSWVVPSAGVNLLYNKNESNPRFTFRDNGVFAFYDYGKINGFVFYNYTTGFYGMQLPFLMYLAK